MWGMADNLVGRFPDRIIVDREILDPTQVHNGHGCDGRLAAVPHVEHVNLRRWSAISIPWTKY